MKSVKKGMRILVFVLSIAMAAAFGLPGNVMTAEAKSRYQITAKSAAGGGITDEGTHTVRKGKDKSYNIYPDAGYRVNYVTIDGKNIGAVRSEEHTSELQSPS